MKKKQTLIHVGLCGASGRMGQSLQKLILEAEEFSLAGVARTQACFADWDPQEIDAVIDFSAPELFATSLAWAVEHNKAFVSGTTALSLKDKSKLQEASAVIPVFYSENMSLGIFLFCQWMQTLSIENIELLLEDYHHKDKKDKPSGTALRIKDHLPDFLQNKLQIKSYREGKEFGVHKLSIKTDEEILTIKHKALNREVFSKGALKALSFINNKKAKLYTLKDIYSK